MYLKEVSLPDHLGVVGNKRLVRRIGAGIPSRAILVPALLSGPHPGNFLVKIQEFV